MKLTVKIKPNAKENKFRGWESNTTVSFSIKAPATEDKANQELIAFISKSTKIPKSSINIIKGAHSRNKTVEIDDSLFIRFTNTFKKTS